MERYYLDMQATSNGFLELHCEGCNSLTKKSNVIPIGNFSSLRRALVEARRINELIIPCPDCHPEILEASDDIPLPENSTTG